MSEVVHACCCGIDVHKKKLAVCLLTPSGKQARIFGTYLADILALAEWLKTEGCTHVAMESTGVYWKPLFNVLEGTGMTVILANPQKIKAIPGRKTDMRDAEWIATLLRRDMIPASFVPDREQRELQELIRYRRTLIEERSRGAARIGKILEGANIKLGAVTKVLSVSGRAMLDAIVAGKTDAAELAGLAKGKLRDKRPELEQALNGLIRDHQRSLLQMELKHIDFLTDQIAELDQRLEEQMRPFAATLERLDGIPGVGETTAQEIVAAIGLDMSRFPSAGHLSSWAKVCPGIHESAGKRGSARTGQGNRYLRAALVEAAHAAARKKGTYLAARYHRLAARRGKKRAAMAVAHSILEAAYYIIRDGVEYRELGGDYFAQRDPKATMRRAVKMLETIGWDVELKRRAA